MQGGGAAYARQFVAILLGAHLLWPANCVNMSQICRKVLKAEWTAGVIEKTHATPMSVSYAGVGEYMTEVPQVPLGSTSCTPQLAGAINRNGFRVMPTLESVGQAVRANKNEILQSLMCPGLGFCADILDAVGDGAWPLATLTWIVIPLVSTANDDCPKVKLVYEYTKWLVEDESSVEKIAERDGFVKLPIFSFIQGVLDEMVCDGVPVRMSNITSATSIRGAGSSIQKSLQRDLTGKYFLLKGKVVEYEATGSGTGLQMFGAKTVDFAGSDKVLTSDMTGVRERKWRMIPVFATAISVIYNAIDIRIGPTGGGVLYLSRMAMNGIFMGSINTWNDTAIAATNRELRFLANGGLDGQTILGGGGAQGIVRVVRSDSSGTTEAFVTALAYFAASTERGKEVIARHPLAGSSSPSWPNSFELPSWASCSNTTCKGISCGLGEYLDREAGVCAKCGVDTFNDNKAQRMPACTPCERQKYAPTEGSETCVSCSDLFGTIINGKCVNLSVVLPAIFAPLAVILVAVTALQMGLMRRPTKNEGNIYKILPKDVTYDDPVHVLGHGSYGQVLRGKYRGTTVAGTCGTDEGSASLCVNSTEVKSLLPPKTERKTGNVTEMPSADKLPPLTAFVHSMLPQSHDGEAVRQQVSRLKGIMTDQTQKRRITSKPGNAMPASIDGSASAENMAEAVRMKRGAAGRQSGARVGMISARRGPNSIYSTENETRSIAQQAGTLIGIHRITFQGTGSAVVNDGRSNVVKSNDARSQLYRSPSDTWELVDNSTRAMAEKNSGTSANNEAVSDAHPLKNAASGSDASSDVVSSGCVKCAYGLFVKGTVSRRKKGAAEAKLNRLKEDFLEEIKLLSKLRHPCITAFMGAIVTSGAAGPLLVMEYLEYGSLYDLLHNESFPFEMGMILTILKDVTLGMRFLHSADPPIVHADLKAANVMVDANFRGKVADFGLAGKHRAVGTPYFMAPELLRGETKATMESDVYAFGITMFEIFSRMHPYDGEEFVDVILNVADQDMFPPHRPKIPRDIPIPIVALLNDCWSSASENRPTFEELDGRIKRLDPGACVPSLTDLSDRTKFVTSVSQSFPPDMAMAIQNGQKVDTLRKGCSSIFYANVDGLQELKGKHGKSFVASLLDRFHAKLEMVAVRHGVLKLETREDAFIAVANYQEEDDRDHAMKMVRFAFDAFAACFVVPVDPEDEGKGMVSRQLTAALHCGTVVACAIGTKSPRFCLLGSCLSQAAGFQANVPPGLLCCSETMLIQLAKSESSKKFVRFLARKRVGVEDEDVWIYRIAPHGELLPDLDTSGQNRTAKRENGMADLDEQVGKTSSADSDQVICKSRYHGGSSGSSEREIIALAAPKYHASPIEVDSHACLHGGQSDCVIGTLLKREEC